MNNDLLYPAKPLCIKLVLITSAYIQAKLMEERFAQNYSGNV